MRRQCHRGPAMAIAALFSLNACGEILSVDNTTDPQIEQVFATAASIEQTLRASFQSCHNAVQANADGQLIPQMAVLSLEGYSTVNNAGLGYSRRHSAHPGRQRAGDALDLRGLQPAIGRRTHDGQCHQRARPVDRARADVRHAGAESPGESLWLPGHRLSPGLAGHGIRFGRDRHTWTRQ